MQEAGSSPSDMSPESVTQTWQRSLKESKQDFNFFEPDRKKLRGVDAGISPTDIVQSVVDSSLMCWELIEKNAIFRAKKRVFPSSLDSAWLSCGVRTWAKSRKIRLERWIFALIQICQSLD